MQTPEAGIAEELEPGVRRVLAPNPSPMTYWGTNSYLVGTRALAVIDPGPDDAAHLAALLAAIGGAPVTAILVTHSHRDHAPLARRLAAETGAPVMAFGRPEDGRRPVMEAIAKEGDIGGGEGVDQGFAPDLRLSDGDLVPGPDLEIEALHTPGHMASHLAFRLGDILFAGDHVMGWASTLVSPPDGDLTAFMQTCARLRATPPRVIHAGHGAPVTDPAERLDWLITHRRARETAILAALGVEPRSIEEITAMVYADTPRRMWPAAARNVLAHLIDLVEKNEVIAEPRPGISAVYRRS